MRQSNADRQKAYRAKKRNAPGGENVTRPAETVTQNVTRVTIEPLRNAPAATVVNSGSIDEDLIGPEV